MFGFLALITNKKYWLLHSLVVKLVLRCYGIRVGRNFYAEGTPRLKINGKGSNIVIGDNVQFLGDVDLRNRENGRIVFRDNVTVEGDCRFVSAREGTIEIGRGSVVAAFSLLNGGGSILVGSQCIIGPRSSINANEHVFTRDRPIREAGFIHEDVIIEDDCWLAANVVIMKGVTLKKGSVIGAGGVVTKDTEEYSINCGVPSRKVSERC